MNNPIGFLENSSLRPPDRIQQEGIVVSACVFMSALCGPYFQRPYSATLLDNRNADFTVARPRRRSKA